MFKVTSIFMTFGSVTANDGFECAAMTSCFNCASKASSQCKWVDEKCVLSEKNDEQPWFEEFLSCPADPDSKCFTGENHEDKKVQYGFLQEVPENYFCHFTEHFERDKFYHLSVQRYNVQSNDEIIAIRMRQTTDEGE